VTFIISIIVLLISCNPQTSGCPGSPHCSHRRQKSRGGAREKRGRAREKRGKAREKRGRARKKRGRAREKRGGFRENRGGARGKSREIVEVEGTSLGCES
jgi:hypothetical protein